MPRSVTSTTTHPPHRPRHQIRWNRQRKQLVSAGAPSFRRCRPARRAARPRNTHPRSSRAVIGSQTASSAMNEVVAWTIDAKSNQSQRPNALHDRQKAKEIAAKLGIRFIKTNGRCVDCHYNAAKSERVRPQRSRDRRRPCENPPRCREKLSRVITTYARAEHVHPGNGKPQAIGTERLRRSVALGCGTRQRLPLVAQIALPKMPHNKPSTSGTLRRSWIRIVSWSQGTIRHNRRTDGKQNGPQRSQSCGDGRSPD